MTQAAECTRLGRLICTDVPVGKFDNVMSDPEDLSLYLTLCSVDVLPYQDILGQQPIQEVASFCTQFSSIKLDDDGTLEIKTDFYISGSSCK